MVQGVIYLLLVARRWAMHQLDMFALEKHLVAVILQVRWEKTCKQTIETSLGARDPKKVDGGFQASLRAFCSRATGSSSRGSGHDMKFLMMEEKKEISNSTSP